MSFSHTKFIIIKSLFFFFFFKIYTTKAEIIEGECSTITKSLFNCSKMLELHSNVSAKKATFHPTAFLKFSKGFKKSTIFNHGFEDIISKIYLDITCRDNINFENSIQIFCSYSNFLFPILTEFLLKPGLDNSLTFRTSNLTICSKNNFVDENFKVFTYMNAHFLVLYGCEKINKTHMELGLMVLQSEQKTVVDINIIMKQTFNELHLGYISTFNGKFHINEYDTNNKSNKCLDKLLFTNTQLEEIEKDTQNNIIIFIAMVIMVLVILVSLIFFFIASKNW